ncbi:MAG TPA: GH116 family glycosyl-hydrolase [Terriglobia bacterium]|nr:GH116 family glycosyl-hydrolase [Terriglobia bacterium]
MNRRNVLKGLVASLAAFQDFIPHVGNALPSAGGMLFPTDLPPRKLAQFPAEGFHEPVCGVIYRQTEPPRGGMALGGIDTGFLTLEADGTFGSCTIFNSISPMRPPLALPFLGMSLKSRDEVWLLGSPRSASGGFVWIPIRHIQTPPVVHYWGHYPVADLEYTMPDSPVSVGMRAWSPFLPGDSATSNTPGAVFEVHMRNVSSTPQQGKLAFMFPGPTQAEAQVCMHSPRERRTKPHLYMAALAPTPTRALRQQVRGEFSGLVVTSEAVEETGYAIGVVGDVDVQVGGGLPPDTGGSDASETSSATGDERGKAWADIGSSLPPVQKNDFSGSVSVEFQLGPGEQKTVRFVMAWFAPMWIGDGPHTFTHMYATRFKGALEAAQFLSRNHDSLLRRVLAWQEVIFGERKLPVWLRESLVNILYLFPVNSLWAQGKPPVGPWCDPQQGLFGMIDGIVEVPAVEPMPDTFYANAPIVFFFPDLALSTLRGYKAYQFTDGAAPWVFGGVVGGSKGGFEPSAGVEMASPSPGYQTATTGPCYVDMVDRYWRRTGDDAVMKEFYSSVKRNTLLTMSLRHGDGDANVISVPDDDLDPFREQPQPGILLEMFEWTEWFGMTPHVGGIHLANLRMLERMAEKVGDHAFAQQCRDWFTQGSRALETQLWAGSYYLAYYEPKTGRKSDNVFGYQLDGEWMAKFHGLNGVFRPDRTKMTLDTIARTCVKLTPYGATNYARPDGSLAEGVGYGPNTFFVPELYMLAMTYLYAGQVELGLELARRCVQALIDNGSEWNQPNILRGDNGLEAFGSHYDQNMMLWAVPAAVEGKDIAAFCAPGGLVDRIILAAKAG